MSNYKIVYTCGNKPKMVSDLRDSINSALKYLNSNDIIVIFSSPYDLNIVDEFKTLCNVIVKDTNLTEPFNMHPHDSKDTPKLYGEKLWITTLPYKNILFLDCDTYINNNPDILYNGEFDFGGVAIDFPKKEINPWQVNQKILMKTKRIYKLKGDIHIWNGGHLFFKNHLHNKIHDTWIRYFNDKSPMRIISPIKNTDDQLSLTPTLSHYPDINIRCYTEDEIMKVGWFPERWKHKTYSNKVCIFHGDNLKEHLANEI